MLRAAFLGAALIVSGAAFAAEPEIKFGTVDVQKGLPPLGAYDAGGAALPQQQAAVPPAAGPASPVHPYVSLEAGGSSASLEPLARVNPTALPNSADPDRRYRAAGGVDYDVSPKSQIGFGYRYSNAAQPNLVLAPAPDTELVNQQRDQAALLSFRYRFGVDR
jgi:hypothetical protein